MASEWEALVGESVQRAQQHLLDAQRPNGSWLGTCYGGVPQTAIALVVYHYLGELTARDAEDGRRWLLSQQLEDGSFPGYPFSRTGSFEASSYACAVLRVLGEREGDPPLQRAQRYVEANGGTRRLSIFGQLLGVLSGELDPKILPSPPLLPQKLFPSMERALAGYVAAWATLSTNELLGLARGLKQARRPPPAWIAWLRRREHDGIREYLSSRQDAAGSWFGTTYNTMMCVACLHSLGVPTADERIRRALAAAEDYKLRDGGGLTFRAFKTEIWDTAFALRSLSASGLPGHHPAVTRAVEYLVNQQTRSPLPPEWQNPRRGAPSSGGWGWFEGNHLSPDCDDTAFVLEALQLTSREGSTPAARHAVEKGLAWLLGMQNRDGGWPAFTHGHRSKRPGPMRLGSFREGLSDPSWEDVTGRVLSALGQLGMTGRDPPVQRAIAFLEHQRAGNGVWWGRWSINYVLSTSCVVSGLRAVGEDPEGPLLRHAVEWLLAHQNEDGGWGERPESYRDIAAAGRGESQPTLTGFALCALIRAGCGKGPAVRKGVEYLLGRQNADGTWQDTQVISSLFPSYDLFYYNDFMPRCLPLEALSCYRSVLASEMAAA